MITTRQSVRKNIENRLKPQHVVIAGAGITGLTTAYYLAKKYNTRSVLVDWSGTIAPGASGKAAGFLARHWSDGTPTEELTHRSFDLHQELADAFGADKIQYRRLTCVSVNQSSKMKKLRKTAKDVDSVKLEWLNRDGDEVFIRNVQEMGNERNIAQVTPKLLCEQLWEDVQKRGCVLVAGRVLGAVHDDETGNLIFVRPNNTAFCTALAGGIKQVIEEPGNKETVENEVIAGVLEAVRGCSGTEGLLCGDPIAQSACYQPVTADFLPVIGALSEQEAGGESCYMASGNNCWGILE